MSTSKRIILLLAMAAIACTALMVSCKDGAAGPKERVLVIHSWGDVGEEAKPFRDAMDKEFREHGVNADVQHIYLDAVHNSKVNLDAHSWPKIKNTIETLKPSVVLVNDDAALDWLMSNRRYDATLNSLPVVFAGINMLQRDSLKYYHTMTGYEDRIDLPRNLEIYRRLTNHSTAAIILDDFPYDRRLRHYLYDQIADTTRYYNNSNFSLLENQNDFVILHKELMVVNTFSCASPERNTQHVNDLASLSPEEYEANLAEGERITRAVYAEAENLWQLQVKYDIFSNTLIDVSRWTQFTCIREQFNDPNNIRFLCGYFTSMQTQVADQVGYAVRIINGEAPQNLSISTHEKGYYLDYNALARSGSETNINDLKMIFQIVNIPPYVDNPTLFWILLVAAVIIVIALLAYGGYSVTRWFHSSRLAILKQLEREHGVRTQLFIETGATVWSSDNGQIELPEAFAKQHNVPRKISVPRFQEFIHPDSLSSWSILTHHNENLGLKRLRIRVSFDEGLSWNWYEIMFNSTAETARTMRMSGLLVNINDVVAKEEEKKRAYQEVNDIELKESFIANISHDLRTPLNAVNGFSNLLTMPADEMPLSDEERQEFCDIIHQNSEMMLTMINNVVDSTIEGVADIRMKILPCSVYTLVDECYKTNNILTPSHLKLNVEHAEPDCNIEIDVHRTKQVINNFISNAFKFTNQGSVTIGWRYVAAKSDIGRVGAETAEKSQSNDYVEIFVQDTGIGISKEDQAHLFDRFYKVKEHAVGTGLGLNISQTIIEKQDGSIGVRSVIGKGSTFWIRLKVVTA